MSLCINPICPQPDNPADGNSRFCQGCGSPLEIAGRYRVTRLLNDKTGFGKVYEAYEGNTPKILKVLKEDLNRNAKAVELFEQEAAVLGQLNNSGIPKVDGYFPYQTRNSIRLHCIGMEKIEGVNLEQWLEQRGNQPISQEQALNWLEQIAAILHLVHTRQYLHRDIKPSNIMLRRGSPPTPPSQGGERTPPLPGGAGGDRHTPPLPGGAGGDRHTPPLPGGAGGDLVLIDFGTAREMTYTYLAKISGGQRITAIESSGYTAPEQAFGQAIPQSDFYSLGRTFVFLLTGRHPLDMYDSRNDVLNWRGYATHVSPLLLDLIDGLMAKDIKQRPANTQDLLQRIEEIKRELTETVNVGGIGRDTTFVPAVPRQNRTNTTLIPTLVRWVGGLALLSALLGWIKTRTTTLLPSTRRQENDKLPLLALIGVLLVALGLIGLTGLALSGINRLNNIVTQRPERKGKVDYFPYIKGADSQGRTAEFSVAVLSVEYKWSFGSTYQIQHNAEVITLDTLRTNLEQEGIRRIMENPTEIVSVGTASCEGNLTDEERRAFARSQQIQLVVKKIFRNVRSVQGYRLLNLGQFRRSGCQANQDLTSYQRSVIVIGVKNKTPGVNVDEALRDRLEKKPFADFKLEDYSLGSPDKFKTISSNL
ncbi:protein kinase domain-containing protein [Microseira wollei]|uniref:non-specific serine/threonine protein kinase n=1 Tax=Microseira wollei NIES-4236 TaxID=2530354 RepID=A0AAV3XJ28_9CYAN|nr:protein kinase [Microseira wollei]GET40736.1 serine/threonine protein kinase [Microseira wollei NIES-4236]